MPLNLLPPPEQKTLHALKTLLGLREICLILLITSGVISMLLAAGNSVLTHSARDLTATFTSQPASRSGLQEKVTTLNQRIKSALKIQNEWFPIHPYIETAATIINDGITLETLTLTARDGTFAIHGFAKNRKDLLTYQEALSRSGLFERIESPLSNILEPVDIPFQLTAKIKGVEAKTERVLPAPPEE